MAKKERYKPEQVAQALKETNGLVYLAAEKLNVNAATIYRYGERHEIVKDAIAHAKGKRLDTAEASLWKAILNGEAWAVCFYLKTQGKERGYIERSEIHSQATCKVLILDNTPGEEPFDPDSA